MDPVLGVALTLTLSYEEWVQLHDLMATIERHRSDLPAWEVTDEDIATADKLSAFVTGVADARVKVLASI